MGYEPDRLGDSWENLVPEQPEKKERLPAIIASLAVSLVVLCLCVAGGYLLYQEITPANDDTILPAVPTQLGNEESSTPGTGEDGQGRDSADPTSESEIVPDNTLPTAIANVSNETAPTATLAEATPTSSPSRSAAIEITAPPSTPIIDGFLEEWAGVPATESGFVVYQVSNWDGTDDLQALWQLAWDGNALFVAVSVVDDQHVQNQSGNQIFRGDSVDMQLDTARNDDFGDGLSPDDFQITLSPGDFADLPPSVAIFQGTDNGQILDKPGGHHIILAVQKTFSGYIIEAAIPWSDLSVTPAAGLTFGIALNANDNDSPGTAVQEVMKSHVSTRTLTDPTGWGTLTLR